MHLVSSTFGCLEWIRPFLDYGTELTLSVRPKTIQYHVLYCITTQLSISLSLILCVQLASAELETCRCNSRKRFCFFIPFSSSWRIRSSSRFASPSMNSNRLRTVEVASMSSCRTSAGPTSLYTLSSSFNNSSSCGKIGTKTNSNYTFAVKILHEKPTKFSNKETKCTRGVQLVIASGQRTIEWCRMINRESAIQDEDNHHWNIFLYLHCLVAFESLQHSFCFALTLCYSALQSITHLKHHLVLMLLLHQLLSRALCTLEFWISFKWNTWKGKPVRFMAHTVSTSRFLHEAEIKASVSADACYMKTRDLYPRAGERMQSKKRKRKRCDGWNDIEAHALIPRRTQKGEEKSQSRREKIYAPEWTKETLLIEYSCKRTNKCTSSYIQNSNANLSGAVARPLQAIEVPIARHPWFGSVFLRMMAMMMVVSVYFTVVWFYRYGCSCL